MGNTSKSAGKNLRNSANRLSTNWRVYNLGNMIEAGRKIFGSLDLPGQRRCISPGWLRMGG